MILKKDSTKELNIKTQQGQSIERRVYTTDGFRRGKSDKKIREQSMIQGGSDWKRSFKKRKTEPNETDEIGLSRYNPRGRVYGVGRMRAVPRFIQVAEVCLTWGPCRLEVCQD